MRREGRQLGGRAALPQCRVEQYLERVDLNELGHHFFASVQTLQEVTVSLQGHRMRDDDVVLVYDEDGQRVQGDLSVSVLKRPSEMRVLVLSSACIGERRTSDKTSFIYQRVGV